jgi:2-desacetyl-2-hydroxyethyl bacteriochlorophyllide A dehydrogenase
MADQPDQTGTFSSVVGRRTDRSVWFSAPKVVEFRETPAREPLEGEVYLEALFSGISHGSEMLIYNGEAPPDLSVDLTLPTIQGSFRFPIKYGYASVGRVLKTGPGVESLSEGDVAFAFNPHETGYTVPADVVFKLPDTVKPHLGIFLANLETAVNAVVDAAPRLGERIAIFGQGVVGLLITQLIRKAGASRIVTIDPVEHRRSLSLAVGADDSVDPRDRDATARVRDSLNGVGADVVFEASGRPQVLNDAVAASNFEGTVVVVSWYGNRRAPISLGESFHRNRIKLRSSQVSNIDPCLSPRWTAARRRELALGYLSELHLEELITHAFPFDQAHRAYQLIDGRPDEVVQVLLQYQTGDRSS